MSSISPIIFQANWNECNLHLKNAEPALCYDYIWKVFCDAIFFLPNLINSYLQPLFHRLILQSSSYGDEEKQRVQQIWERTWVDAEMNSETKVLRQYYNTIPLELTTPDGATISGTFFKSKLSENNNIPTIIYFQTTGDLYKTGTVNWMLKHAKDSEVPFNVVAFDYRDTGESIGEGNPSSKGLILDGDTVYQFVSNYLEVKDQNISIYGRSLGGAISAQVVAMHENIEVYVNSHSFASLDALIDETDMIEAAINPRQGEGLVNVPPIAQYVPISLIKFVAKILLHYNGWEFDTLDALKRAKNRKFLLVSDPLDDLIQNASVTKALDQIVQNARDAIETAQETIENNIETVRLELKTKVSILTERFSYHNAPYALFNTDQGEGAGRKVLSFLLGKNVSKSTEKSFRSRTSIEVREEGIIRIQS
jgi:pimeloyl-ACP methyl ester carboxylesterase